MKVGLTEAAALTGKSPSTLTRAAKKGKLTVEKDDYGRTVYETSELERAFGQLQPPSNARNDANAMQSSITQPDVQRVHDAEKAALERLITHLEASNKDLTTERDRLLGIIEEQSKQVALLTDQRQEKADPPPSTVLEPLPEEAKATPPKTVWQRLFGR